MLCVWHKIKHADNHGHADDKKKLLKQLDFLHGPLCFNNVRHLPFYNS